MFYPRRGACRPCGASCDRRQRQAHRTLRSRDELSGRPCFRPPICGCIHESERKDAWRRTVLFARGLAAWLWGSAHLHSEHHHRDRKREGRASASVDGRIRSGGSRRQNPHWTERQTLPCGQRVGNVNATFIPALDGPISCADNRPWTDWEVRRIRRNDHVVPSAGGADPRLHVGEWINHLRSPGAEQHCP